MKWLNRRGKRKEAGFRMGAEARLAAGITAVLLCTACGNETAAVAGWAGNEKAEMLSGNDAEAESAVMETAEAGTEVLEAGAVETDETEADTTEQKEPVKVRGIYVTGGIAGHEKMDELITLVEETELNTLVIDIKNDEGRVTYQMDSRQAQEIGAPQRLIGDIEELVRKCREKDIYLIGRVVAFKDPYLAEKRPELCVRTKDGAVFRDGSGLAWVNPYRQEVWDYLVEIAAQAAADGFDEIQFDYIRFSTDLKPEELDFGEEAGQKSRTDVITEFTEYVCDALHPLGVKVSADVYGTVIDNQVDQEIVGQQYAEMAKHLDAICPMVYPSHYGAGNFGLAVPDAKPYETVYAAMSRSKEVLAPVPEENRAAVRVWLQAFTAKWVPGHISYGKEQIREQIHAVCDAGYEEWILWNAAVNYKRDYLLTEEEAAEEAVAWEEERTQKGEELQQDGRENGICNTGAGKDEGRECDPDSVPDTSDENQSGG